jgi:uncharacterized membrane protein
MEWGMMDFEEGKELGRVVERPMFEGEILPSVIDGKPEKYYSDRLTHMHLLCLISSSLHFIDFYSFLLSLFFIYLKKKKKIYSSFTSVCREKLIGSLYSFAVLLVSIAIVIASLPVLYVVRLIFGSVICYILTAIVIQVRDFHFIKSIEYFSR